MNAVHLHLRRAFGPLLGASLISPLLLTGCGPDLSGYQPPACQGSALVVSGLSPTAIPDFVQLRARSEFDPANPTHVVLASFGDACATATDQQACQSALASLAPDGGFRSECLQFCRSSYLVTTRGDQVQALTSIDAVRTFLGGIDTPQEAALLAYANGYQLTCDDVSRGGIRPRTDGGFDVIATTGYACGKNTALMRQYLRVTASGEVLQEHKEVIEQGDPNCTL